MKKSLSVFLVLVLLFTMIGLVSGANNQTRANGVKITVKNNTPFPILFFANDELRGTVSYQFDSIEFSVNPGTNTIYGKFSDGTVVATRTFSCEEGLSYKWTVNSASGVPQEHPNMAELTISNTAAFSVYCSMDGEAGYSGKITYSPPFDPIDRKQYVSFWVTPGKHIITIWRDNGGDGTSDVKLKVVTNNFVLNYSYQIIN